MDIPFSRWYPAIKKRRSRRNFNPNRPIEAEKLTVLDTVCKQFTPFPYARSCLVIGPAKDVFKGIVGSYGKVQGAPAFIAFIGNMKSASVQEEVGYTGEGIVLEATALGLNTCWVGGFFRRDSVASLIEIDPNEQVLAVTPVGYAHGYKSFQEKIMTGFGRTQNRLPLSRLVKKAPGEMPDWVKLSLEAARNAPSAANRQPWGFDLDNEGITVLLRTNSPDFNVSKRLDCGITMLHLEVAALYSGHKGKWMFPQSRGVARFTIV